MAGDNHTLALVERSRSGIVADAIGLGATGGPHEAENLQQSPRGDPAAVAPLEVCAPVRLHSRRKDDLEPVS